VIDHFARIGADGQFRQEHLDQLCRLAERAQVSVKLSAFYALGKKEPPYLDLAPMIQRLLKTFGADRLMWGSDSPFQVLGKHTYRDSVELLRSRLEFLTPDDRRRLLRTTAEATFFN
jgi:L-fuconolactonase